MLSLTNHTNLKKYFVTRARYLFWSTNPSILGGLSTLSISDARAEPMRRLQRVSEFRWRPVLTDRNKFSRGQVAVIIPDRDMYLLCFDGSEVVGMPRAVHFAFLHILSLPFWRRPGKDPAWP